MKSEISEASVEIRSLYQAMQTVFGEGELLSTEALNPDMEFQPGCLTSVIKRMTELVEGSDQLGQTPNRVWAVMNSFLIACLSDEMVLWTSWIGWYVIGNLVGMWLAMLSVPWLVCDR